ncbi:MAG: type II toxin-antitoxin system RelE/ParE family toxin [Magnetococcus sp. YQC-9]
MKLTLGATCSKNGWRRAGGGKSGGYRTIVGYRRADSRRIIFLYAFPKNAKANITDKEEAVLSLSAEGFLAATDRQISELLADNAIFEVCDE